MTDMAPKLGGWLGVPTAAPPAWHGRPPAPTCPDYPKLAQLWWKNVAQAVTGEKTPQGAMDTLADEMDQVMARLERAGMPLRAQAEPQSDPSKWLSDKQAPRAKLANEKPRARRLPTTRCCRRGRTARRADPRSRGSCSPIDRQPGLQVSGWIFPLPGLPFGAGSPPGVQEFKGKPLVLLRHGQSPLTIGSPPRRADLLARLAQPHQYDLAVIGGARRPGGGAGCRCARLQRGAGGFPRFRQRDVVPRHEAGAWWSPIPGAGQYRPGARGAARAHHAAAQRAPSGAAAAFRDAVVPFLETPFTASD